jgi:uncharacterized protein DUF6968
MKFNCDLEFDEPIAERSIKGDNCTITIQLGPLRRDACAIDDDGWYCPYRIMGIPGQPDQKMFGIGADGIQAIIAALSTIGVELKYHWKERLGLMWSNQDEFFGFIDGTKLPG